MKMDDSDLEFARRLERVLSAPTPAPPDALLRRIHATIGTRNLHAEDEAHTRMAWTSTASRAARWALAAGIVGIGVLALVVSRREPLTAGAMTGRLTFSPAAPRPGDDVRVTYEPSASLSRFTALRLRARFRTPHDLPSPAFDKQLTIGTLGRRSDGTFAGTFVFPRNAVFAAFAVEDDGANVVDANRRALWTLLVPDSTGAASFEALEQRVDDIATSNWELALTTAREATRLHPEQVRGWVILQSLQSATLDRAARDSATAEHRARLASLDARASTAGDDELGAMVDFAARLGDTVRANRWRSQLARRDPRGIWGLNALVGTLTEPRRALAYYDSLWSAGARLHPGIANFGLSAAQTAKDTAATSLWLHRMLLDPRVDTTVVAQLMVRQTAQPGVVAEGMALLRSRIVRSPAEREARRPLEDTRAAARIADDEYRAATLRALGDALLATGGVGGRRAAADTLALAAQIGWDPMLFRKLADLRLTLADTAGALDMLARAAADPLSPRATNDSLRGMFSNGVAAGWTQRVARATDQMREQMLSRGERTTLPRDLQVVDANGAARTLTDLVNGKPTLIAFWSSSCPPSIAAMPALLANGHALLARGFNVVAITEAPLDSATMGWLRDRHFDLPVYSDRDRSARLALAQWGTPEFFVLDGRGRLRYRMTALPAVGAELESLR